MNNSDELFDKIVNISIKNYIIDEIDQNSDGIKALFQIEVFGEISAKFIENSFNQIASNKNIKNDIQIWLKGKQ